MRKCCLLLLLLAIYSVAEAQQPRHDTHLWLWLQVTKQLPKRFSIAFQYRIRFSDDMSQLNNQSFFGVASYRFNKYLSTSVSYRFSTNERNDEHTFFASLNGRYRISNFTIGLRTAFQRSYPYFNSRYEPGREPTSEWRNRLLIRYDINKKWDVYAFAEPFIVFQPQLNERGIWISRVRTIAGVEHEFYKYNTISLFYMFQPQFDSRRRQHIHLMGISYEFDIPRKMNWKKFFSPKKKDKGSDKEKREKDDTDNVF